MLNYALELGLQFTQFGKSSQYLIKVAQEMIRKRRQSQDDSAYVKVCLFYVSSALLQSVNRWVFSPL